MYSHLTYTIATVIPIHEYVQRMFEILGREKKTFRNLKSFFLTPEH